MTDEERLIFHSLDAPAIVTNWDEGLPKMYDSFNACFFKGSLPSISETFVCVLGPLPREVAGVCLDANDASKISTNKVTVRPGIRINSKLECLTSHVAIALLHEMTHASGKKGHEEPFQKAIAALYAAGAYNGHL